jgi:hypothetical protein
MFPLVDKVGNAVSLGGVLVLSILLLLPDREREPAPHPAERRPGTAVPK